MLPTFRHSSLPDLPALYSTVLLKQIGKGLFHSGWITLADVPDFLRLRTTIKRAICIS